MDKKLFDNLVDLFRKISGDDPADNPEAFLFMIICVVESYCNFIRMLKDEDVE